MGFEPTRPRPRWGIPDVFIAIVLGIVSSTVLSLLAALATGELQRLADGDTTGATATIVVGIAGQWVGMVGWLWFCSRRKGQGTFRDDFGLRWKGFADVALGVLCGFGALFAAGLTISVVARLFGTDPGTNTDKILESTGSDLGMVLLAFAASFGAPVVEELLFRGLALRAFERRLGPIAGIGLSTLVFAVLHFQGGDSAGELLSLLAGIFVLGFVFAVVARWRATLVASICAHMTVNLTSSIAFLAQKLG